MIVAEHPALILSRMEALADPTRVRLLRVLDRHELAVADLCQVLGLPQSTVSRHLKLLAAGGWVHNRSRGPSNLYRSGVPELDGAARRLWRIARDETARWPTARHDQLRLARRLTERQGRSRSFFAGAAARWDALRRQLYGENFALPALAALLPRDWVVADLGCGTGVITAELARGVRRVIGVDASDAMLAVARRRVAELPNVELAAGDLESLPLDDASCDAALAILSLSYVANPSAVVGDAARVIRPGGRFVIVDLLLHDRDDLRRELGQIWPGFEPAAIDKMLAAAGFRRRRVDVLTPAPEARGPALFLAAADRGRDHRHSNPRSAGHAGD